MTKSNPVLVACSHGTSSVRGSAAVAALVAAVRAKLHDVKVVDTFVDVQSPALPTVLDRAGSRAAVVVPLLLSPGYHVHHDIAQAVKGRDHFLATEPLGPSEALIQILVERLAEAGFTEDDSVVLGASASSDQAAVAAMSKAAALLSERLGRIVPLGHVGHCGTALAGVVDSARRAGGRVFVASYLLAPGHFHDELTKAGADVVTAPLLDERAPDDRLVDLVIERYTVAVSGQFAAAV